MSRQLVEHLASQQNALSPRRWVPGNFCSICGTYIFSVQSFNWDHEIPMSRGGRRGRPNKRFAHLLCNSVKGDRFPFSLRTPAEREAARAFVRPQTYRKLQKIWKGEPA